MEKLGTNTDRGFIKVDGYCKTNVENIYANFYCLFLKFNENITNKYECNIQQCSLTKILLSIEFIKKKLIKKINNNENLSDIENELLFHVFSVPSMYNNQQTLFLCCNETIKILDDCISIKMNPLCNNLVYIKNQKINTHETLLNNKLLLEDVFNEYPSCDEKNNLFLPYSYDVFNNNNFNGVITKKYLSEYEQINNKEILITYLINKIKMNYK